MTSMHFFLVIWPRCFSFYIMTWGVVYTLLSVPTLSLTYTQHKSASIPTFCIKILWRILWAVHLLCLVLFKYFLFLIKIFSVKFMLFGRMVHFQANWSWDLARKDKMIYFEHSEVSYKIKLGGRRFFREASKTLPESVRFHVSFRTVRVLWCTFCAKSWRQEQRSMYYISILKGVFLCPKEMLHFFSISQMIKNSLTCECLA